MHAWSHSWIPQIFRHLLYPETAKVQSLDPKGLEDHLSRDWAQVDLCECVSPRKLPRRGNIHLYRDPGGEFQLSDGYATPPPSTAGVAWNFSESRGGRCNSSPGLSWSYSLISSLKGLHAACQQVKWDSHALASLHRNTPDPVPYLAWDGGCQGSWSNHKYSGLMHLCGFLFHL